MERKLKATLKKWIKLHSERTSCISGETRVQLFLAYLFHEITFWNKQAWSVDELTELHTYAHSLAQEALNY